MHEVVIHGLGGHGRMVADLVGRLPGGHVVGGCDDGDGNLAGVPCWRDRTQAVAACRAGALLVVCIGDNRRRLEVMEWYRAQGAGLATLAHPGAWTATDAHLGRGTVVAAGAVIQAGARLGDGVIVNTCASVDHDGVVGDGAHLAPGVRLCGGVQVGAMALVGAGAVVLPGVRLGQACTIGAGAVVVRDVEAGMVVAGVPARPLSKRRKMPRDGQ